MSFKKSLIELGEDVPELRGNLKPILSHLDKKAMDPPDFRTAVEDFLERDCRLDIKEDYWDWDEDEYTYSESGSYLVQNFEGTKKGIVNFAKHLKDMGWADRRDVKSAKENQGTMLYKDIEEGYHGEESEVEFEIYLDGRRIRIDWQTSIGSGPI